MRLLLYSASHDLGQAEVIGGGISRVTHIRKSMWTSSETFATLFRNRA